MPHGWLRNARLYWQRHEVARRYDLSPRWVRLLTDIGIETAHWSSLGSPKAPDTEIMSYARERGYVVLTHDLDFSALLAATSGQKPSVVQIRTNDLDPEKIGKQVVAALLQMASDLELGALLTIDPKRTRVRLLPLPSRT